MTRFAYGDGDHIVYYCDYAMQTTETHKHLPDITYQGKVVEKWEHDKRITAVSFRPAAIATGGKVYIVYILVCDDA